MFTVNATDIASLEADLKTFASRAYPFATKQTINRTAFEAQRMAKHNTRVNMVTRNRFSEQSIQVEQSRTLIVSRQAATVGSIADYMETQEFGGIKTKQGSEGVSITTGYAAGQEGAQPRTKLARKPNRLQNIQLSKRRKKGTSRKQQNLAAIKGAATSGRKYVFLDLGRTKGIFRVVGGKRNPKIKMVHDMSRTSVVIPANPWLKPAVDKAQIMLPEFYGDALLFQARRAGLFRS